MTTKPLMIEQTKNYTGPSTSSPSAKPGGGGHQQLGAPNQARGLVRWKPSKASNNLNARPLRWPGNQVPSEVTVDFHEINGKATGTVGRAYGPSRKIHSPHGAGRAPVINASLLPEEGGRGRLPDMVQPRIGVNATSTSSLHNNGPTQRKREGQYQKGPWASVLMMNGTQRFILTNTGSLTTKQLYMALTNTLKNQPLVLRNILRVKQIFQPNRRTRFDIWVKDQSSAGLQRALGLDYNGRQLLAEQLEHKKLSHLERITQGMLPRYRLSKWKSYRDRVISKRISPTQRAVQLNQFLTWNINGIQSKLTCLKDLLLKNNVAVAAIQEHLRTVYQATPTIPNYNIFEQPREEGF
jgi:hypothetical protein